VQHLLQTCRVFASWLASPESKAFKDDDLVRGALQSNLLRETLGEAAVAITCKDNSSSSRVVDRQQRVQPPPSDCFADRFLSTAVAADGGPSASENELEHLQHHPQQQKQPNSKRKQWLYDAFTVSSLGKPTCRYCGAQIVSNNTTTRKKHLLNIRKCR